MQLHILKALALVGLIAGCQNASGTATTTTSAGDKISQIEVALTAAEKAATLYIKLPQCTAKTKPVCSEADVIVKIKAADNIAYDAVTAAKATNTPDQVTTALKAVSDLVAVIPAQSAAH